MQSVLSLGLLPLPFYHHICGHNYVKMLHIEEAEPGIVYYTSTLYDM